jgi:hypothetical protein
MNLNRKALTVSSSSLDMIKEFYPPFLLYLLSSRLSPKLRAVSEVLSPCLLPSVSTFTLPPYKQFFLEYYDD